MTSVHQPRIAPESAPGALYVRIATESGKLLDEHALSHENARVSGVANNDQTEAWLAEHPEDRVFVYVYDGDSGECVQTIICTGDLTVTTDEIEIPDDSVVLAPRCPGCDGPPVDFGFPVIPWFCRNDDCKVLSWDPYDDPAEVQGEGAGHRLAGSA
jgi:hypothetical protein